MSGGYPITRQADMYGALGERRPPLLAGPHESLVYEMGTRYAAGGIDEARAPRGTVVCVVDVRRDVPLHAGRRVPGAGGPAFFWVEAVFDCTVVDPLAVVRARDTYAIYNTCGYLADVIEWAAPIRHDPHSLRRSLTAQLRSLPDYWAVPGIQVALAHLEISPIHTDHDQTDDDDFGEA